MVFLHTAISLHFNHAIHFLSNNQRNVASSFFFPLRLLFHLNTCNLAACFEMEAYILAHDDWISKPHYSIADHCSSTWLFIVKANTPFVLTTQRCEITWQYPALLKPCSNNSSFYTMFFSATMNQEKGPNWILCLYKHFKAYNFIPVFTKRLSPAVRSFLCGVGTFWGTLSFWELWEDQSAWPVEELWTPPC